MYKIIVRWIAKSLIKRLKRLLGDVLWPHSTCFSFNIQINFVPFRFMFTKINVALKDIWRLIDLMFSVCLHLCLCVHLHDMSFFIHHYRCWAEEQDSLSIRGSVVLWKETWFLLIIFLPLNKRTWPDESVSCLWSYGRRGWWSTYVWPVSVHTTAPSRDTQHKYIHHMLSFLHASSFKQTVYGRQTNSGNQTQCTDGCL